MKDNGQKAFVQAYNAQIAVDSQAQIIVAAELTQQTTDRQQLLPMVESIRNSADCTPEIVVADAGYWDTTSLLDPALEGIQVLVSPDAKPQLPGASCQPTHPAMKKPYACEKSSPATREKHVTHCENRPWNQSLDKSKKLVAFVVSGCAA